MAPNIRTRTMVLIINILVNVLILTPICAYYYFIFNKLSKHQQLLIIHKRYPNIIKLSCYFCFFILLIERTVAIFTYADLNEIVGETVVMLTARLSRIIYVMLQGVIFCGLWRFWLIFYDLKIAYTLSESEWKKYLNSQLTKNNWFINNKRKYGSKKYIQKIIMISWLIFSVIRITFFQLFMFHPTLHSLCRSIDAILYLIPVVLVLIIGYKAPSIEDKFYLKKEITYYCFIVITAVFIYIICIIIGRFDFVDYYWIQIILCIIAMLSTFGLAIIQTGWIVHKIKKDPAYIKQYKKTISKKRLPIEMGQMQKDGKDKEITMKSYLSEQQGFELFVHHLQKEFSLEIILFLLETSQLKSLIKKKEGLLMPAIYEVREYKHDVYQGIFSDKIEVPKSQIVYQIFDDEQPNIHPTVSLRNKVSAIDGLPEFVMTHSNNRSTIMLDEISKLKTVCWLIYDRYIAIGSELEINISSGVKKKLIQLLSNPTEFIEKNHEVNKQMLCCLFDDAIKEQLSLMTHSFTRFKMELNRQ